jgi:hypothetical protein
LLCGTRALTDCCCCTRTHTLLFSSLRRMKKNLYEMATNLKWDFNSDKIAGYVVKADIQELRPFEIDPAAKSRVQIADELWSTMS